MNTAASAPTRPGTPKQLETENSRLKWAVGELTLDNQILKEAAEGNF